MIRVEVRLVHHGSIVLMGVSTGCLVTTAVTASNNRQNAAPRRLPIVHSVDDYPIDDYPKHRGLSII